MGTDEFRMQNSLSNGEWLKQKIVNFIFYILAASRSSSRNHEIALLGTIKKLTKQPSKIYMHFPHYFFFQTWRRSIWANDLWLSVPKILLFFMLSTEKALKTNDGNQENWISNWSKLCPNILYRSMFYVCLHVYLCNQGVCLLTFCTRGKNQ